MALPTFTDVLRTTVAALQAAHPARVGEIARAHAAIIEGHVVPVDAANGKVLSRNGHAWYGVNGACDCQAGRFGKPCRHLSAWKLYKHVQQQGVALQAPEAAPAPVPVETEPAPVSAAQALPEAPASVNVRLMIDGREVQLTLRDTDETPLLARLTAVLAQYPAQGTGQLTQQQHNAAAMHRPITGVCPVHNVPMKLNQKDGRSWYSHRLPEGGFCKGR